MKLFKKFLSFVFIIKPKFVRKSIDSINRIKVENDLYESIRQYLLNKAGDTKIDNYKHRKELVNGLFEKDKEVKMTLNDSLDYFDTFFADLFMYCKKEEEININNSIERIDLLKKEKKHIVFRDFIFIKYFIFGAYDIDKLKTGGVKK